LQRTLEGGDEAVEILQRASATQFPGIVGHGLEAKYALAFGIDLQSQPAAVQLEDRQIIHRSLDRDFPLGALILALTIFGPVLVADNGLDGFYVEWHAAAVDQRLKYLLHLSADFEQQIEAVLDLIARVLITAPAALLFLEVEREAKAGSVDPALADPAQTPYSPLLGQGVCDPRQGGGLGNLSKAVGLLKLMPALRAWQATYS
jgi:hypothetical protein